MKKFLRILTLTAVFTAMCIFPVACSAKEIPAVPNAEVKEFTVTFDVGTDEDYIPSQRVVSGQTLTSYETPKRAGYVFDGWCFKDGRKFNLRMSITEDTTLYAKWLAAYAITFNTNGGNQLDKEYVPLGDNVDVNKLPIPEKEHHKFLGWYTDANCETVFDGKMESDINLYAKWEAAYEVRFMSNSTTVATQYIYSGKTVDDLPTPTAREHYRFLGWYTNVECTTKFNILTQISADTVLYAGWEKACKVTFISNKVTYGERYVFKGETLGSLLDPQRNGYRFLGWYENSNFATEFDIITKPIESDTTLYAKWEAAHVVKFISSNTVIGTIYVFDGEMITEDLPTPTRDNYKFLGWYTDDACNDPFVNTTIISGDKSLYAGWAVARTVTFNTNGGDNLPTVTVFNNEKITELPTPTKENYKFLGWYSNENCEAGSEFTTDTVVTSDITLYAKWEAACKVEFNSDGVVIDTKYIFAGNKITGTLPTPDAKANYKFLGWYTNSNCTTVFNTDDAIAVDTILYAGWEKACKVTFISDGVEYAEQDVFKNEKASVLDEPNKDGYRFAGWYKEETFENIFNFDDVIAGDITLYAKWIQIYTVTYNTHGGNDISAQQVDDGATISEPTTTRSNYELLGWYTDAEYNDEFNFVTPIDKDLTLHARWIRNVLDLCTLKLDGTTYKITKFNPGTLTDTEIILPVKNTDNKAIVSVGTDAFKNCTQITSIIIPEGYTSIGACAFAGCSNLHTIKLPAGLTEIGDNAFMDAGLTTITIPSSVTSIGDNIFKCSANSINALTSITVESGNNNTYTGVGNAIIDNSGKLIAGCKNTTIDSTVNSIGDYVFSNYTGLTSISIPANVSIGKGAFQNCSSLTSVTIATGCNIGESAFASCTGLTNISISTGVTIGVGAFMNCTELLEATINSNIGNRAFYGCKQLFTVTLKSGVQNIGINAFEGCKNIRNITIPASVTFVGSSAFNGCEKITYIYVNSTEQPNSWASDWKGNCTASVIVNNN